MILECGKCSKMYRVRDDAATQPTQCPTCGGDLRAAGGGVATSAASRVRELETRIQNLERELEETRNSRPTLSVETSPGFSGMSSPVAELRSAAEKADRLERELLSLRSEMEQRMKEKESEITSVREVADRETAERRKLDARASGLEETHARALEGKDKTIQALDASIASYRAKVDALQKKLDAVEIQRLNDLNTFDSRVREREQSDRDALDAATSSQQRALVDLRAEMESTIADKDRLISEGRQALDREAAERRRLTETLKRLQDHAGREVAEKSTVNAALEANLASYKNKIETLQKRVDSLEQMRRTEHDQVTRQLSSRQAIRGRVDEASHLAVDLDHSLDSIEASIASLRDRARRLKESLQQSEDESAVPPELSSLASSLAPLPEPEIQLPRTPLSQTDIWDSVPTAPAAPADTEAAPEIVTEPEPQADAEPQVELVPAPAPEPEEAPETFTPVTRTQIKVNPYVEPLPDAIEAELSPEPTLADSERISRLDEPSQMIPAAAPAAPEAASRSKPATEETDDLPLISPPEAEKPGARPPAAKPEEPKRKKFSWQRK
jgi:uncharacterized coiled-coil protein SlyX